MGGTRFEKKPAERDGVGNGWANCSVRDLFFVESEGVNVCRQTLRGTNSIVRLAFLIIGTQRRGKHRYRTSGGVRCTPSYPTYTRTHPCLSRICIYIVYSPVWIPVSGCPLGQVSSESDWAERSILSLAVARFCTADSADRSRSLWSFRYAISKIGQRQQNFGTVKRLGAIFIRARARCCVLYYIITVDVS